MCVLSVCFQYVFSFALSLFLLSVVHWVHSMQAILSFRNVGNFDCESSEWVLFRAQVEKTESFRQPFFRTHVSFRICALAHYCNQILCTEKYNKSAIIDCARFVVYPKQKKKKWKNLIYNLYFYTHINWCLVCWVK